MVDVPSTWNFGRNWPTPFKNVDFLSIFAAPQPNYIAPSEKSSKIFDIWDKRLWDMVDFNHKPQNAPNIMVDSNHKPKTP